MEKAYVSKLTLSAVVLVLAGCNGTTKEVADVAGTDRGPYTAYVGATVIDGTGAEPIANAIILVEGDNIVKVGDADAVNLPDSAEIVDVGGRWIVPGLIDAHTHFFESGRIYTSPGRLDLTHLVPFEEEVAWMQQRVTVTLQSYLCAGVTSNVSVGGPRFEYEVRAQAKSMDNAPNVFVAHGPVSLVPSETLFPLFDGDTPVRTVTNAASTTAMIKQGAEWGADLIKSGYLGGPFAADEDNYIAVHEAIVAEARRQNLRVTAHVTELEPARELIRLGVDSLQHLPMDDIVDEAFIDLARLQKIIVVPTLAVMRRSGMEIRDKSIKLLDIEEHCGDPEVIKTWFEVDDLPQTPPELRKYFAVSAEYLARNLTLLYEAGVPLAAGSDAGNMGLVHGASLHYELQLMSEAGIAPSDLIIAATLNAARVAGQEDIVGSLEAGKLADLVILTANPLSNISNLQAIESVVKSGKLFAQSELLP